MYAFKIVTTTLIVLMLMGLILSGAKVARTKSQVGIFIAFIVTYAAALVSMWG